MTNAEWQMTKEPPDPDVRTAPTDSGIWGFVIGNYFGIRVS